MIFWFKKKFNSLKTAGLKYYGNNFILPILLPVLIVVIVFLSVLSSDNINLNNFVNIIVNTMLQFMYLSLITFLSIVQNIVKNRSSEDDFFKNPDFWISLVMLVVFIIFYGIQVYQSFILTKYSIKHICLIFILMSTFLYFAISIYSEYSEDSNSSKTSPSIFANNRERRDNKDHDWESRL